MLNEKRESKRRKDIEMKAHRVRVWVKKDLEVEIRY